MKSEIFEANIHAFCSITFKFIFSNKLFKSLSLVSKQLLFFLVWGFPADSDGKESTCKAGELGLIPGLRKIPWKSEWLPIPVFLPEQLHEQRSLEGCYSPWGCKESDMAEWLTLLLSPGIFSPSFHQERKLWGLPSAARAPWVPPSPEVFPAGPWSLLALTKASRSQCYSSYRYLSKRWSYSLKVFVFRAFSLEELALVLSSPSASGTTLLQNSSCPLVLKITGETLPFPLSDLLTASGNTDELGKTLCLLFDFMYLL